jgi:hypothetical protein
MSRCVALAVLLFLPSATATAASSIDEVRQCLSANLPQAVRIQTIEMTSWDRGGGQRTLKGRVYATRERDQPRIMARVDFPLDVAGTALLVRDAGPRSEMYLYLPSYQRVRRLTGVATGGKLWGTDFSYDEFRRLSNAFADGNLRFEGAEQREERAVHVMSVLPSDQGSRETIRVLVDQKTCVPLQAEFVLAGRVRKRMSASAAALRKSAHGWYLDEVLLQDLAQGTRTRMKVLGVTSDPKLSAGYFNPSMFYSAH